jgi:hypothetical protein
MIAEQGHHVLHDIHDHGNVRINSRGARYPDSMHPIHIRTRPRPRCRELILILD